MLEKNRQVVESLKKCVGTFRENFPKSNEAAQKKDSPSAFFRAVRSAVQVSLLKKQHKNAIVKIEKALTDVQTAIFKPFSPAASPSSSPKRLSGRVSPVTVNRVLFANDSPLSGPSNSAPSGAESTSAAEIYPAAVIAGGATP